MRRRVLSMVLVIAMVVSGITVFPSENMSVVDAQEVEAVAEEAKIYPEVPMLSGCNYVEVLKDSKFDEKSSLTRLFAMDKEEGDLTDTIKLVSVDGVKGASLNTGELGEHTLVYRVADSGGNASEHTTVVKVVDAYTTDGETGEAYRTVQKTLYFKESSGHTVSSLIRFYRGYYHDRQHLGIYLKAGQSFRIRIVNGSEFNDNLGLQLLNDDGVTEQGYTINKNGEWLTVVSDKNGNSYDSIPFVYSPTSKVQPILEYQIGTDIEELTLYHEGDGAEAEAEFFAKWDANQHGYVVLDCESTTFLIPRLDRNNIINNTLHCSVEEYRFKTIEELFTFYNDFLGLADEFSGLEYNAEDPLDENVRGRFFVKADKSCAGLAVYTTYYTSEADTGSVAQYLCKGWVPIHECTHGFEGSITEQGELYLFDVFNNIISHYIEKGYRVPTDNGWGGLQNLKSVEKDFAEHRRNNVYTETRGYQSRLYTYVNLFNKIGPTGALGKIHSDWRKQIMREGVELRASDSITLSLSEYSGYNLAYYMEENGYIISDSVKAEVNEQKLPYLTYLAEACVNYEEALQVAADLGLDCGYAMVTNEELAITGKTGTVKVHIDIDDIELIKGKRVYLMSGEKKVRSAFVEGETVVFENVPIGTYDISLPTPKKDVYSHDYYHVLCADKQVKEVSVVYNKVSVGLEADTVNNALMDDYVLTMRGDKDFAKVDFSTADKTINVNIFNNKVRDEDKYRDVVYCSLEIFDPAGETIYYKEAKGGEECGTDTQTFPLVPGTTIKLFQYELDRCRIKSVYTGGEIQPFRIYWMDEERTPEIVKYVVDEKYCLIQAPVTEEDGWKPEDKWSDDGWDEAERLANYKIHLKSCIDKLSAKLTEEQLMNKTVAVAEKGMLLSALSVLTEEERAEYADLYQWFLQGAAPIVDIKDVKTYAGAVHNIDNLIHIYDLENEELTKVATEAEVVEGTYFIDESAIVLEDGKYVAGTESTIAYKAMDEDGLVSEGTFVITIEVDKADLAANIAIAEAKKAENYTPESFETLTSVLAAAKEVYEDTAATAEAIAEKNSALREAITGLVSVDSSDKLAATGMIAVGEAAEDYDPANVLDGAEDTFWCTQEGQTRQIVINMGTRYSLSGLEIISRQDASTAGNIEEYEVWVSSDAKNYTKIAEGTLEGTTITFAGTATARYVKLIATKSDSEIMAIAELGLIGEAVTEDTVDKAEAMSLLLEEIAKGNYTDASYQAYQKAYTALAAVVNDIDATKKQVEVTITIYKTAVQNLTITADKTVLQETITEGEAKNPEEYSAITYQTLQRALTQAKMVYNDTEATQDQVDTAVRMIENAIARLKAAINTPTTLPVDGMSATVGSYEFYHSGYTADKVLDGDINTIWHTQYSYGGDYEAKPEQLHVTLYLGGTYDVTQILATPRQSGTGGKISKYEIQVSMDGKTFYPVARGNWNSSLTTEQVGDIGTSVTASYVRLFILEALGYPSGSLAELRVVGNDPKGIIDRKAALGMLIEGKVDIGEYAETSYAAYVTAFDTLEALTKGENATDSQDVLDAAVSDLEKAMQELEASLTEPAKDKTGLAAVIAEVKALDRTQWSPGSLKKLDAQLAAAEAVYNDAEALQGIVDAAKRELSAAKAALVEIIGEVTDLPRTDMTAYAPSIQGGYEADKVLDGNTDTQWHTKWNATVPRQDQYITINLGETYDVYEVVVTPRLNTDASSARVSKYEIQVSMDNVTYYTVAQGTWGTANSDLSAKTVAFRAPVTANYVKVVSVESTNNETCLAEIVVRGTHELGIADVKESLEILLQDKIAQGDYSDTSYAAYETALTALAEVVDGKSTQEQVDTALANYKLALQNLEASLTEPAKDKTGLAAAIAEAEAKKESDWSPRTYKELAAKLAEAKAVYEDAEVLQGVVDKVKRELLTAMEGLEPIIDEVTQLSEAGMTATSPNYQPNQGDWHPDNVLDNDLGSVWQTKWGTIEVKDPATHYVTIDMGDTYDVYEVVVTPRNNSSTGGRVSQYKIQVSMDGETYYTVAMGEWATNNTDVKTVVLDAPVCAKYLRFVSVKAVDDVTVVAEIDIRGTHAIGVDYTAALAASFEEKIDRGYYEEDVYTTYENSITALNAVIAKENTTQEEVDEAVEAYYAAIQALKDSENNQASEAQREVLNEKIAAAKAMDTSVYSPGTVEILKAKIAKVQEVYADTTASVIEVNEAMAELNEAIANLRELNTTVGKLTLTVDDIKVGNYQSGDDPDHLLDGDTSTIWHTLHGGSSKEEHYVIADLGDIYEVTKILARPRSGAGNGTITKYEILLSMDGENFYKVSEGTWERTDGEKEAGVVNTDSTFLPVAARYVKLQSLESYSNNGKSFASLSEFGVVGAHPVEIVDRMEALALEYETVLEQGSYTEESYNAYTTARTNAINVAKAPETTAAEMEAALAAYNTAKDGLRTQAEIDATDKTALKAAIDTALAITDTSIYPEESVAVFTEKLAQAQNVYDNATAVQLEVDAAKTALEEAMEALVEAKYLVSPTSRLLGTNETVAHVSMNPADGYVNAGDSITVTAPIMLRYTFKGWYMLSDINAEGEIIAGATAKTTKNAYTFKPESDMSLVAVYEAGKTTANISLTGNNFVVAVKDGETTTSQNGTYTKSIAIGSEVTVTVTDGEFINWLNEENMIVTKENSYTFVVIDDVTLKMSEKGTAKANAMVEFVSAYNQVIAGKIYENGDTVTFPDGPSKMGYIFKDWSLTPEEIQQKIEAGETHVTVTPTYERNTSVTYTVTVYVDGVVDDTQSKTGVYAGTIETFSAPAIDGKEFLYWTDETDTVLGYDISYGMNINKNIILKAVYGDAVVEKKPVIAMTNVFTTSANGKNKLSFTATRDIPEGYTLVETGMLYSVWKTEAEPSEDTFILGGNEVRKYVSPDKKSLGIFTLNVNVTNNESAKIAARGYVVVKNATGSEEIYYTDVVCSSYNEIIDLEKGE